MQRSGDMREIRWEIPAVCEGRESERTFSMVGAYDIQVGVCLKSNQRRYACCVVFGSEKVRKESGEG